MTYSELYSALDYVDHSRHKRKEMSNLILNSPLNIATIMEIAFQVDDPVSCKACWIMEFTAKEHLPHLFPYMDNFVENIGKVHLDPAVRPIAKICEYLMKSYFQSKDKKTCETLTDQHLEGITSACFDWLIGDHKVAAQAYSMTSLLLLGRKFHWIHPELRMILEQNYQLGSAAYKARARMTLAKL
ncbi:adenylosuccinate lyase [Arenibacter sp. BSSL-BM3]|uniref:Adenylosuccinate lyase n=2 Tax=Arenibacter arenosicollis TaxID=2762274 RepID=A0ABR7QL42_9FLAO|nr:adenylosuccinate lyase [Arenibacter arenosicollis]MBC8767913.1 adenylosuccinate lyase [Arenibacter arenosicollis]